MLNKIKENKKKGFTLVELIVVLVILAILAAMLVPALTGYIDKAKEKTIIAETRQVVMAAQTLADEKYAENKGATIEFVETVSENDGKIAFATVKGLAEVTGTINSIEVTSGKITKVVYVSGGQTCTYASGAYKVEAATPAGS